MAVVPHDGELPNIARIGALIGNSVRAQLIGIPTDGSERSASEPAALANGPPQSVSAHLTWLVAGVLPTIRPQGRPRFYRLRSGQVASAIEVLSLTATESLQPATFGQRIRGVRRCYDHAGGRLAVAMCDDAVAHRYMTAGAEGDAVSKTGSLWLGSLDIEPPFALRRPPVRLRQDWTVGRPHLAGWLGAALCRRLKE